MNDREATVRAYYTAMDGERTEDALSVFDPAVRYVRHDHATFDGRDALEAFYRTERVPGGEHLVATVVEAGDLVLVDGRYRTPAGAILRFCDAFQFRGDHVVARITYPIG